MEQEKTLDQSNIDIAGKTGTAENPHGRDHGWFVAYGPFDNPSVVVAVIVEQGGYGAASAVPIGRKILEAAFNIPDPAKQAELERQRKQAEQAQKNKQNNSNSNNKAQEQPAVVNNAPVAGKEYGAANSKR